MQFNRLRASVASGAAIVGATGLGLGIAGASCVLRSPAAHPPGHGVTSPALVTCTGHAVVEPAQYTMPCADGDAWVTGMHWTAWSTHDAHGAGTLVQDNCLPNCAAGTFVSTSAQVELAGVVHKQGAGAVFSRMVVHYRAAHGRTQSETFYLAT